ncbi:MAG: O-antigen polysaccharide polymerase Wzy [Bacilli bacterium]|nr:O-antigen polysaccharide polymerase Wzy [Bacilli bacterium]
MYKKNVSIYQVLSIFLFIFFLLVQIIYCNTNTLFLNNLKVVSFMGIFLITFIVFTWYKSYYRLLSPYLAFVVLLFLFLCGQTPFWLLNQSAGFRDLTVWMNLFNSMDLCNALIFSYLCISFLHTIVICSIDPKTKKTRTKNTTTKKIYHIIENREAYKNITIFGLILCLGFIGPYLITFFNQRNIIKTVGYDMQYDTLLTGTSSFFTKIADFFPLGIITLVFAWGNKNELNKKNFFIKRIILILLSLTYLMCELLLGQRTGVVLFVFALLFVIYKEKKIPINSLIFIGIGGLLLMAGLRIVGITRSGNVYNPLDQSNPIVDFISDTGWNLMSLSEFQKIMPEVRNYGYGNSYIVSLLEVIPNLNFWNVHPAYVYGNISQFLREYLGYSYGLGCTPVAEAYYNFGYFGFLIFLLWGLILIILNRKFENNKDLISNYTVVLFIGILLKSCVRSSFYAVFRPFLLFILLPIIILKLLSNKELIVKEEV